jgi:hypothetical protein
MDRKSAAAHLTRAGHGTYVQQRANEQRQQHVDNQRRQAAYDVPPNWDSLPDSLHDLHVEERPNLLDIASQPEHHRSLTDLNLSSDDFVAPLPPVFDSEAHAQLLREEAEAIWLRLSELRLDDVEDEEVVADIEDLEQAGTTSDTAQKAGALRSSCLTYDPIMIDAIQRAARHLAHQHRWTLARAGHRMAQSWCVLHRLPCCVINLIIWISESSSRCS